MIVPVWHLAIFLAYFVKGLAGFGNSLIHNGIMALLLDNAVIAPVETRVRRIMARDGISEEYARARANLASFGIIPIDFTELKPVK